MSLLSTQLEQIKKHNNTNHIIDSLISQQNESEKYKKLLVIPDGIQKFVKPKIKNVEINLSRSSGDLSSDKLLNDKLLSDKLLSDKFRLVQPKEFSSKYLRKSIKKMDKEKLDVILQRSELTKAELLGLIQNGLTQKMLDLFPLLTGIKIVSFDLMTCRFDKLPHADIPFVVVVNSVDGNSLSVLSIGKSNYIFTSNNLPDELANVIDRDAFLCSHTQRIPKEKFKTLNTIMGRLREIVCLSSGDTRICMRHIGRIRKTEVEH